MKQSHLIFTAVATLFFAAFALQASADVQVGTGSFVQKQTTGTQVVEGVGFQPKAVMFFYASTTFTDRIINATSASGFGIATGATGNMEGAVGTWSDGGTISDTGGGHNEGDVIIMTGANGVTYGQAQLTSFDAEGFTLNWSSVNTWGAGLIQGLPIINYIAIGGDDITNASSSSFTLSTASGNQSISGMGFKPDFVLLLPAPDTRAPGTFTTAESLFSLGFGANSETNGATSTIKGAGVAICAEDANTAGVTNAHQNGATTSIIGLVPDDGSSSTCSDMDTQAELRSFDSDGFTIQKVDPPAAARTVYYLAIRGGQWNVGSFNKATAAGSQSITGNGFMPKGVFMMSTGLTTSALSTQDAATNVDGFVTMGAVGTTTASKAGFKAADAATVAATTSQVGMYRIDDDGDGTPDPESISTTTMITGMTLVQTQLASAYHSLASYASHDPDGFTINWSKSDTTAREFLYWTVGEVASTTQRAYAFFNDNGSLGTSTIGTYMNSHFDISGSGNDNSRGITFASGFFWITDTTDDEVYKYRQDGTYANSSFDTAASGNTNPGGIAFANGFFWVTDFVTAEVYKYNPDGTYANSSFDTAASGNAAPYGIIFANGFFWITDGTDAEVYKYNSDGTYANSSFDTAASGNAAPVGIIFANGFFWITDQTDAEVYKYNSDGTYANSSFDTAESGNSNLYGITFIHNSFWLIDDIDDEVYQYDALGQNTLRRDTVASTAITGVRQGERLIARLQIDEQSNMATSTNVYRMQWENNTDAAGTWNDLGSTTQIAWSLSQYAAPRTRERRMPTPSARVTSSCTNSIPYIAGEFIAGGGTSTPISLRKQCTELAYAIETSNALRGKTYRLRLIDGVRNDDLEVKDGTYAAYPTLTIARDGFATASTTYWKGVFGATTTVAVDGKDYNGGQYASLVIGSDGNPMIAHYDATQTDLRLARCLDLFCTATTSVAIDGYTNLAGTNQAIGEYASLAIGIDGNPVVGVEDATLSDIRIVFCRNALCTATTSAAVAGEGYSVGDYTSLAIGSDGNPMAVADAIDTNNTVRLVRCLRPTCAESSLKEGDATTTAIFSVGTKGTNPAAGQYASLALGQNGRALAASYDTATVGGIEDLRMTFCLDSSCAATTTINIEGTNYDAGSYSSLAIGPDGNPLVAHQEVGGNADLRLTFCRNSSCTATTSSTAVDGANYTGGQYASLAIGIDGNPFIAHYESGGNDDLRLARCLDASCAATTTTPVDGMNYNGGQYASLVLSLAGNPMIAHYNADTGVQDLRLAVCHSLDCTTSYPAMSTSTAQATTSPYWFFDQGEYDNASTSNDSYAAVSGLNSRLVQQFSHASTTNTDPVGVKWEGGVFGGDPSGTTTLEIYNFAGGYWEILATGTATSTTFGSDYTLQATTTGTASDYYNGGNRVVARVVTATTSATTTQSLATDFINISFGSAAAASLRQHFYRWRNDDGNEVGASWAAAEDTALSSGVFPGDRRRLRVSVSNATAAANNITHRLEYASSSCTAFIPVKTSYDSSEPEWIMDPSYYLSEEGATTAQLSVPAGKTFAAGLLKNSSNQTSAHNLTATGYTEHEYAVKSTAKAQTSLTYCFRLTNAGTAFTTYSVTPSITISSAARPQTGGGGGEGVGAGSQQSGGTGQGGGAGGEGSGSGGQTGGGTGVGGGGGSQEFVPWLMPWFGYLLDSLSSLL